MNALLNEKIGEYIERKMREREYYLSASGKIEGKRLSRNHMAKILGVSGTWLSGVINGDKEPSDELLLKIANFLEIDEHEIFKVARRVHPQILEKVKKEYLGEFYLK